MAVKRKPAARKVRSRSTATRRRVARKAPVRRPALRKASTRRVATRRRKVARRKVSTYQSAVSMITFYLNRGGRGLPRAAKKVLRQAKTELSKLVHRRR